MTVPSSAIYLASLDVLLAVASVIFIGGGKVSPFESAKKLREAVTASPDLAAREAASLLALWFEMVLAVFLLFPHLVIIIILYSTVSDRQFYLANPAGLCALLFSKLALDFRSHGDRLLSQTSWVKSAYFAAYGPMLALTEPNGPAVLSLVGLTVASWFQPNMLKRTVPPVDHQALSNLHEKLPEGRVKLGLLAESVAHTTIVLGLQKYLEYYLDRTGYENRVIYALTGSVGFLLPFILALTVFNRTLVEGAPFLGWNVFLALTVSRFIVNTCSNVLIMISGEDTGALTGPFVLAGPMLLRFTTEAMVGLLLCLMYPKYVLSDAEKKKLQNAVKQLASGLESLEPQSEGPNHPVKPPQSSV